MRLAFNFAVVIFAACCCTLLADDMPVDGTVTVSADWPQWRGPGRDGQVPRDQPPWPDSLSKDHLEQAWRVELGASYSGPIVVGDRVYALGTVDEKTEVVTAFDRNTGRLIWKTQWPGTIKMPNYAARNGDWIRSTPACDGKSLYVGGIRDVLVCLACADGKERWRFDFVKECKAPLPKFGLVCSPLVVDGHVYVQAGASFCKLDKRTGRLVWQTLVIDDGKFDSAYSSPVIATLHGKRQLVVQTRFKLAGVDIETGKVLWSEKIPAFRGMNILTPTVLGNRVFTSSFQRGSYMFDIQQKESGLLPELLWESKAQGYMSSPVVVDGHIYLQLGNRRVSCLNIETGKRTWTSKPYGEYWSLAANEKKILALDSRGTLYLLRANPEKLDVIDSRKISEAETWAHLAVCGNRIYVRELNALAVYKWQR